MRDTSLSTPALDAVRPSRAGGSRARKRSVGRRLPARLSMVVGSAGLCAIMIGIVINATMFQKGHHPAPLFASAAPARPAAAEPPPLPVVPPAPAPAPVVPPAAPVAVERHPLPPAPAAVKPASGSLAAVPAKPSPARHVDGIAHLLGTLAAREPAKPGKPGAPARARTALARPAAPLAN